MVIRIRFHKKLLLVCVGFLVLGIRRRRNEPEGIFAPIAMRA